MFDSTSHTIDCANPVNWSHPALCAGRRPVGWWMCIPGLMGGGKWHDLMSPPDLAGGQHGTLTSLTQTANNGWRATNRRGGLGEMVLRSASSNSVIIPWTPRLALVGSPFSLHAWVNMSSLADRAIFGKPFAATHTNPYFDWLIWNQGTTGVLQFRVNSTAISTPSGSIVAGAWTQIVMTANGTTWRVYVNGVQVTSSAQAGLPTDTNSRNIRISGNAVAGELFDGMIDDCRVYPYALSADEVYSHYWNACQGYPGVLNRVSMPFGFSSSGSLLMRRRMELVA